MKLPDDFISQMSGMLDTQSLDELVAAIAEPSPTSIRLNTQHLTDEAKAELTEAFSLTDERRIPWCSDGFYLDQRPSFTMDPLFHAGAYYVQEASSMYIAWLVQHYIGTNDVTALDLCAAPGGKSTLLLSSLSVGSTLIANEIVPRRASILRENISKWNSGNSIVTNDKPADFRKMDEVFDLILCDVPCSGEGMFRKDETAIQEWSLQNVAMCSNRQCEIISDIWHSLKPGGLMIYSTCTYNTSEDEENVKWISQQLGADILPCLDKDEWNITHNLLPHETFSCCHFMPHKQKGEGFFCAILRKHGESDGQQVCINNKMLKSLNVLTLEDRMADCIATVDVDRSTALQYLRGEALKLDSTTPKGIVTITYRKMPLGKVKNIGNRANNLYPKEWRIRKQI